MYGLPCRHFIAAVQPSEFYVPTRWVKRTSVRLADPPPVVVAEFDGHRFDGVKAFDDDTEEGIQSHDDMENVMAADGNADSMRADSDSDTDNDSGGTPASNNPGDMTVDSNAKDKPDQRSTSDTSMSIDSETKDTTGCRTANVAEDNTYRVSDEDLHRNHKKLGKNPRKNPYNDVMTYSKQIAEQVSVLNAEAVELVLGTLEKLRDSMTETSLLRAVGDHVEQAFQMKPGPGGSKRYRFPFERGTQSKRSRKDTARGNVPEDTTEDDLGNVPVSNATKKRACTFCGLQGHNKQTCTELTSLGRTVHKEFFALMFVEEKYTTVDNLDIPASKPDKAHRAVVVNEVCGTSDCGHINELVVKGFTVSQQNRHDAAIFWMGDVLHWASGAESRRILYK